ncbi:MAG: HNH endonuclease [Chloroflexi bacterium]|nr:HNH endonuclease [Chloroflexota bacterium]
MEVNHIKPLKGRGYRIGCAHHLDNLQTLCHRCHVDVTKQQRASRTAR